MATIKSYTDLEQSKKLAEILPLESADMWWLYVTSQGKHIAMMYEEPDPHYLARMESYGIKDAAIRCWSLAALLDVLPDYTLKNNRFYGKVALWCQGISVEYDNPVDACYEMILQLNGMELL